jgi:3',5'-cyclic AMP phosphodiesterase CpdA
VRSVAWLSRAGALLVAGVMLGGAPAALGAAADPSARAARPASSHRTAVVARVVVLGDIACDPSNASYRGGRGTRDACRQQAVGRLVARLDPTYVVTTGDNQYEVGALGAYRESYAAALGGLRGRTWPVPGNHDYGTPHARGYLDYFGPRAGTAGRTWRARQPLTGWRVLLLDSDCWAVGGCGRGSAQHRWLRRQLTSSPRCTIAVWHHPFLTAGAYRGDAAVRAAARPLWATVQRHGVDLVLNGHDHNYQRFAPRHGLREFVVGTGGRSHYQVTDARGLKRAVDDRFGVLVLTLRTDHTYRWAFRSVNGARLDHGSSRCTNAR